MGKTNDDGFDMGSTSESSSCDEIPMEMDLTAAGPPISDDESLPIENERKCVMYAKRILPHVGLVCLLFTYLLIGAAIFYSIEGPNELRQREIELSTIFGLRRNFSILMWNITRDRVNISIEAFELEHEVYFNKLVRAVFLSFRNQYINERHLLNTTRGDELLWTFPNSVFFATAVITTIGYGNIVPITYAGRIACIIFALFGIPLLLVTIADIGKFLSEFLSFLYRSYRAFVRKLRRQSRRISHHYRSSTHSYGSHEGTRESSKAGSINLNDMSSDDESTVEEQDLRIPVFMVLLVLLAYTGIGGLLFKSLEDWTYFEAFYFCFITMATIGFGDIVPTEQMYMFFTMLYIIFGLSLATMCIDLAGTEYIQKIHYLGSKMGDAKGAVISGLQVGEHILKHTGIEVIKTAGGKLVQVRGAVLNKHQVRELGYEYFLEEFHHKNILYEPLSANVLKLVKESNIKVLPGDITEKDGYIVQNKTYDQKPKNYEERWIRVSENAIHRVLIPRRSGSTNRQIIPAVFGYKESDV